MADCKTLLCNKLKFESQEITSQKLASQGEKKHIRSIQHTIETFMLNVLSFEKCENSIFAIPSAKFFHSLL